MLKISIITVCYNSINSIEKTIESVLNQSYSCYEYIIIDGGSSDGTVDVIKKYENAFVGRLKYYSESDKGIYDAMNKGIKKCSGEMIGILNSDDYYEKDTLKLVSLATDDYPYQIIYGMLRQIVNNEEMGIVFTNHHFLEMSMINHPTCFVSKKIYDDYGLYNTAYKIAADYDYMLMCFKNDTIKFKPIYKILTNFGMNGISSQSPISRLERAQIQYKYGLIRKRDVLIQKLKCNGSILLKRLIISKNFNEFKEKKWIPY